MQQGKSLPQNRTQADAGGHVEAPGEVSADGEKLLTISYSKAMQQSAGTLLYRRAPEGIEVLLVHPSGPYNRRAPWSIPKGVPEEGEPLELAARRETAEETGVQAGELVSLGTIDYRRSRKRIYGFGGSAPDDADPRCASWEVDRAEFVALPQARQLIHPDQVPFLDRLQQWLDEGKT